jgi:peptidoglycan/xylan/chitin deacetylase (PgdA/CDA1 family)
MNWVKDLLCPFSRAGASLMLALQRCRKQGVIVLYHRVSPQADPIYPPIPPALFEEHLQELLRLFEVVRLAEFLDRLKQGKPLAGCCAITFDDGYRDFLDHAYPILRQHRIPVTHFLVLDSLLKQQPTWNWRLNRITYLRDNNPFDMPLTIRVGQMTVPERETFLLQQEKQLGSEPGSPALLSAQDLARVDPELVEWGSHSVTHSNLGCCDPNTACRELIASRQGLEEVTGKRVRYFSYPNGSYSPTAVALVPECGYEAALVVDQVAVTGKCSLYALPRFNIAAISPQKLMWELSGTITRLRRLRSRLRGAASASEN